MFEETIVENTRGLQASKWDEFYPKFDVGGKTLWAPLEKMNGAQASQFAARMRVIEERKGGTRKFHSGVDKILGKSFVRVRPDNELPLEEEEKQEKLEQQELPIPQ